MRAITLWQPWASLIAEGVKSIETRPKRSPWSSAIGETIAIHAAVRPLSEKSILGCYEAWPADPARGPFHPNHPHGPRPARLYNNDAGWLGAGSWMPLPLGAVVATCTLTDVVPMVDVATGEGPGDHDAHARAVYLLPNGAVELVDRMTPFDDPAHTRNVINQVPFGDFAPGRWALLLDNVQKCEPFPCRGYQGLWTVPADVEVGIGWATP